MKIALLGDIALFGCNSASNTDYIDKFKPLKSVLSQCDYIVGNLETPLTESNKTVGGKSAYIKGRINDISILKYLGITHVSLANNHIFDYCQAGVDDTIHILESAGIDWFGLRGRTVEIDREGNRLRLYGYCCYSTNGKGLGTLVDVLDPVQMEEDIKNCVNDGFFPVLSCHWGQEHVHFPNYDHVILARKLSQMGRIIIQGHHPHVVQGIENRNGSLIAYSLGNFCFDDVYTNKSRKPLIKLSQDNRDVIILVLEISDNQVMNAEIYPFEFDQNGYYECPMLKSEIEEWSKALFDDEETFRKRRKALLDHYITNRKKLRDFEWYLKRMNFESARMIISSRLNSKRYNIIVKGYIDKK